MIGDFFKMASNLKKIQRQGWVDKLDIDNPESVADHSYSMAIMGMIISDMENYNSEKILKIILLHDLAESEIGDFIPGEISKEKKVKLENDAFSKIIPWDDYQNNEEKLELYNQAKIYQELKLQKTKSTHEKMHQIATLN